jgi:hypothetical protein
MYLIVVFAGPIHVLIRSAKIGIKVAAMQQLFYMQVNLPRSVNNGDVYTGYHYITSM